MDYRDFSPVVLSIEAVLRIYGNEKSPTKHLFTDTYITAQVCSSVDTSLHLIDLLTVKLINWNRLLTEIKKSLGLSWAGGEGWGSRLQGGKCPTDFSVELPRWGMEPKAVRSFTNPIKQ